MILQLIKENSEFKNLIIESIILYIWFIATTKITSELLYVIVPLGAIYFIIYIYQTTLDPEDKDIKITETIELVKLWITRIIGISIIIGVILYYGEKRLEYGNKFNIMTFIVGKIKCKVEYVSSENEIKNLIILEMKNRSKLSYIFGGY